MQTSADAQLERLIVTGASGFVGRALIDVLAARGRYQIVAASRALPAAVGGERPRVERIAFAPNRLAPRAEDLAGATTLVHVGALTGKASPAQFERANVAATRELLEVAVRAKVRRIVYVSTIAVNYPEQRHYAYARSKAAAEALVRASPLEWAIARPTIVLGPNAAAGAAFAKLARGAFVPLFGPGTARIQPIDVGDLAQLLADLIGERALGGRTLEFGGSESIGLREWLARLHSRFSRTPARFVRIPLRAAILGASWLEPFARSLMPVTAGQLYVFAYDSLAASNPLAEARRAAMKSLDLMLDEIAGAN